MNIKTLFCTAAMAGMLIGCHNDETHKTTASSTTQAEKPPVFEYGFNLNNFNIVKDTVKEGDTFGKLLEHHHMTVSDIHQISQQTSAFIHPKNFIIAFL